MVLVNNLKLIIKISLLLSISYFTYAFSFIFINAFAKTFDILYIKVVKYEHIWLIFDALLVFFIGRFFKNLHYNSFIFIILLALIGLIVFISYNLYAPSFEKVMLIKLLTIIIGVCYSVPLTCFIYGLCNESNRYIIIGASYVIGNDIIGKSFTPVMLYLTKEYSILEAMLYPLGIIISTLIIFKNSERLQVFKRNCRNAMCK